ncbi:hypothetical protein KAFR_0G03390 [Kazachstania africana CBS 2517]|uniref:mRNA transport regulator MTR2 n=1 Tax=Kazachstania africana (strain ATCC 22294 / BCRC 22015 / CBS 2517 / CECT 1963 / NBRC 1671 / NRRL Y-8276) TaxID=1071382 RepID=H2AYC1_KAZAF|nr:hypothetical protein KAFR_0G03390 [Kazachstania africana CBS 2517]CCF59371.1 hypothetical protein KAFR_0G03390 [Kazachstania africana CBS 2517]
MNTGNAASTTQQPHITETFVQKILAHLDNTDINKLNDFLSLFKPGGASKIIFNSQPFNDPMVFLTMWQQQVVTTQHSLTSIDYHVIPGSGTLICNVNAKVRFDESGRDKAGQDSIIRDNTTMTTSNNQSNRRNLWGPYFGISLQLIIDDRIYRNDFNGVIGCFNYNMVYKPEDTLIKIN